jgi:bacillithiol biosynthesis cysteine-adding enzyme BshC
MTFTTQQVAFKNTSAINPMVLDYLAGTENLNHFYTYEPNFIGIAKAIEGRSKHPVNRNILYNAIKNQYANIEVNEAVIRNLNLLLDENTFTVATGHQLNLFTGPLYFIYKIASAIKLAETLCSKNPDKHFVPVYWMATEDHDFDEINHTYVFDNRIEWYQNKKGATGKLTLENIEKALNQLQEILGTSSYATEIYEIISQAYLNKQSWADATKTLVNSLFGKYGLIIIDASVKELKSLFIPYLKDEINHNHAFLNVGETTQKLNKQYKTQVYTRPINLFYMVNGIRERIEEHNDGYQVLNTDIRFSKAEIESEIENNPQRFSPNVILRPVYQETILPNIAYIGGGAEVSYWLQFKLMFDKWKVFYPVVLLRNSFLWVEKSVERKINQLQLKPDELFLEKHDITKKHLMLDNAFEIFSQPATHQIESIYEEIGTAISKIDVTLETTVLAEKQKALNGIKLLEEKALKAAKRKNENVLTQINTVKDKLFPAQNLQERYYNFAMFYSKYGQLFIETIIQNTTPIVNGFTIITETDQKPT